LASGASRRLTLPTLTSFMAYRLIPLNPLRQ
jgi:hypothetical protein